MQRVVLFDRFDAPIGELAEGDVFALTRVEKVNGEHSLTITTTRVLEQGWRILTCDARGKWREHVVYGTDALHANGERPFGDYYCVWSIQPDLMGTRVSAMPGTVTPVPAATALDAALGGTARWARGTVTNTNTGGASMYDTDGWSAISTLVENWGGEIDVTIEVGSAGVVARKVDLYSAQGEQTALRRFDFGADIASVRRKVADGPLYCRITPRGRGEETGDGYGRKITIESVNDGKDYLESAAMVPYAKLPDGNGGWEYPTLEVENPDCTTPAELLAWSQGVLDDSVAPKVTYEVDVLQLAREGADMQGVSLGDAVQVVDRKFGGMRISERVMEMTVNMLDEADIQVKLGGGAGDLASFMGGITATVTALNTTVKAMSTADYIDGLLDRINAEISASGGYTYIIPGNGIRTYDAAVSDPLVGAEASKVVEVKGGAIRIADSRTAQGEWDWRTVFVSGHIAADMITAVNVDAGLIKSADNSSYWDLDSGNLVLSGTLSLTLPSYIYTAKMLAELSTFTLAGDICGFGTSGTYKGFNLHTVGESYNDNLFITVIGGATSTDGVFHHPAAVVATGNVQLGGFINKSDYYDRIVINHKSTMLDTGDATTFSELEITPTDFRLLRGTYYNSNSCMRVNSSGNFSVTGTKSRCVRTDDYNDRLLYSYETPSPMFGDIGSGTLDPTGYCYVSIDDIFGETARTDIAYQVFLQACGPGELYVAEKARTHFVVRGEPGLAFDWEVKAKQTGYENLRLEDTTIDDEIDGEMSYGSNVEGAYADEMGIIEQLEAIYAD